MIKGSKANLDYQIGLNQGVLDNNDFLKRMIREQARKEMKNTELTGNERLTKQDFNNLVESLFEEYEQEYQN